MPRLILCVVLCCLTRFASAQTFGEIIGEVKDPSGAVIAGAAVSGH